MAKYKVSALERRLCFYPHPKYHKLVLALSYNNEESKAKTVEGIIKKFFDGLPEIEKEGMLKRYLSEWTTKK